jgi:hypothetical protein
MGRDDALWCRCNALRVSHVIGKTMQDLLMLRGVMQSTLTRVAEDYRAAVSALSVATSAVHAQRYVEGSACAEGSSPNAGLLHAQHLAGPPAPGVGVPGAELLQAELLCTALKQLSLVHCHSACPVPPLLQVCRAACRPSAASCGVLTTLLSCKRKRPQGSAW